MADPFTADGASLVSSHEWVSRAFEVGGIPIAGVSDMTGGGSSREGRVPVYGAGDVQRGLTNGKVKLEDITIKLEVATWDLLRETLKARALLLGDISETAHQKIDFQVVDQWRGADVTQRSKTITYTVRVGAEKPATPNSGEQFGWELTCNQVKVAEEKYL